MSDVRLDVYLLGEPQPGVDRPTLVRNLATTFKKDVPVIEKMLRKPRSLLKADVDSTTAAKYKHAIQKAGGQCELVTHGEQLFPSEALTPVAPRPALTLAPVEPSAQTTMVDNDIHATAPDDISNEFVEFIQLSSDAQMIVSFRIPHLRANGTNTIIWTPIKTAGGVEWDCLGGTMNDRYRMPECRGGTGAN